MGRELLEIELTEEQEAEAARIGDVLAAQSRGEIWFVGIDRCEMPRHDEGRFYDSLSRLAG